MSLHPCKECGHQISSDAKTCPQCGKKQKRGIGLGAVLGIFILFIIIVAAIGENKGTSTRPSFPPGVLPHIATVYQQGTDFAQACARHESLSLIHAKLLTFRDSTVSAIEVIDNANFPPAYRTSGTAFRKGLVEARDGANRTLQYWRTGDANAIPAGERQVQAGLGVINAEVSRLNNRGADNTQ